MNEILKQSIIDLLEAAKAHIEAGETAAAIEKIEAAVATIENEGVESASEEPGTPGNDPENPPLPGTGSNGRY